MPKGTNKPESLNQVEQRAFEGFSSLPNEAKVSVKVVAALDGVTTVTVWRRVRAGLLPAPVKSGGSTRWIVGELRARA